VQRAEYRPVRDLGKLVQHFDARLEVFRLLLAVVLIAVDDGGNRRSDAEGCGEESVERIQGHVWRRVHHVEVRRDADDDQKQHAAADVRPQRATYARPSFVFQRPPAAGALDQQRSSKHAFQITQQLPDYSISRSLPSLA